jgi:hypothetical protein
MVKLEVLEVPGWSYHVPETIIFDLKIFLLKLNQGIHSYGHFFFFLPQSENVSALPLDAHRRDFIGGEDSFPPSRCLTSLEVGHVQ